MDEFVDAPDVAYVLGLQGIELFRHFELAKARPPPVTDM